MTFVNLSITAQNNLEHAYANPKLFQKKYSMRYFLATRLLPKRIRTEVEYLYAFVRIPDEIIDTEYSTDTDGGLCALKAFEMEWVDIWNTDQNDSPFLSTFRDMCKKYRIPFVYTIDFMYAMKTDSHVTRYATYHELEGYMHGSAGVVGYMLTYFFGFTDGALTYATSLAYGMQMTNFLRDIQEDYAIRHRIYIPDEDMNRYHVTMDMIAHKQCTSELVELMKYEVSKTRALYRQGYRGLGFLSKDTRLAVYVAGRMYERILDRIEQNHFNPFIWKSENTFHKLWYLVCAVYEFNRIYKKQNGK